ncbi:6-hydroxymethylpterin diphosphokinase MptE-like protein [Roseburia faecis]|uniref:6-hydroxymethylpterin diphosphokinase MptE-like protein n=1 Tax=Roseburia faecis TaxID=301302 RepID=UPI003F9C7ACC
MLFNSFEQLKEIVKEVSHKKKVYIWGTGVYGDLLGKILNDDKINWYGYYDNFTSDTVNFVNNKRVISGSKITHDLDNVYILSMRNYEPVKKQLEKIGTDVNQIFAIKEIEVFNEIEDEALKNEKFVEQIKGFHNIHEGESCFVIGNGPSLSGNDLEMIYKSNIKSFGCNSIYKAYNKTQWRPDYYVLVDVYGIAMAMHDMQYISDNCKYLFSRSNGRLRYCVDKYRNIRLFKSIFSESEEDFSFSEDCAEHLFTGHTVTYAMLQLAVYMGFKKIYLLGIDHQYATQFVDGGEEKNNVKNYSSLLEADNASVFYRKDKTTLAYMSAKRYADAHGIKIYNATRGGKLEVFERVDFDSLF